MAISSDFRSNVSKSNSQKRKINDHFSSEFSVLDDNSLRGRTTGKAKMRAPVTRVEVKVEETAKWIRKWEMRDVFFAMVLIAFHVLSLFAPFTFTWPAFWVAVVLYIITFGFGLSLSYHRNLTHRSFKLPKYLEYFFAYCGLHALQGDPILWVSTHRYHHKVSDTDRDPHTPNEGFWFSYVIWSFDYNKVTRKGVNEGNVEDLKSQPYYRFLERTLVFHAYLLAGLLCLFGGFPFVVWGMGVRTVASYHALFLVNSIGHRWGRRPWKTGDLSTNVWYLSLYTFGESWHNNHHAFDWSARHGLEWWEIDLTWYFIKLLAYLGLATNLKVPSEAHKLKKSFSRENDSGVSK